MPSPSGRIDAGSQSTVPRRSFSRAVLNSPITNARHLLHLPAEYAPVKIGKLSRLLTVNFEVCN